MYTLNCHNYTLKSLGPIHIDTVKFVVHRKILNDFIGSADEIYSRMEVVSNTVLACKFAVNVKKFRVCRVF